VVYFQGIWDLPNFAGFKAKPVSPSIVIQVIKYRPPQLLKTAGQDASAGAAGAQMNYLHRRHVADSPGPLVVEHSNGLLDEDDAHLIGRGKDGGIVDATAGRGHILGARTGGTVDIVGEWELRARDGLVPQSQKFWAK